MESTSFLPKLPTKDDAISRVMIQLSRSLLILAVLLSVVLFIPGVPNFLVPVKVYLVVFLVLLTVILYSFSILRTGAVSVRLIPLLVSFWAVVAVAGTSASLSPTPKWSLFGEVLEIQTVGFLVLLGAVITLFTLVGMSKRAVAFFYGGLMASAGTLMLFHTLRILFGPELFSFGQFTILAATPVGSFNDFGLLVAMSVLVVLVAVVQLKLSRLAEGMVGLYVIFALGFLAIVNFFSIWIILGLFSLLILMYSLTRDRFGAPVGEVNHQSQAPSGAVLAIVSAVFVSSGVFLVAGASLGNTVSTATGVSYLEVRPSLGATTDILRQVYQDSALLGSGPNRFANNWQQYKDASISETVFWNTSFNAGSGYIPTWFVTTGVLGSVAWIVFILLFVYTGSMMLLRSVARDTYWYFIGTVSFVLGLFVWGISLVYVPGPVILLLGAAVTGCLLVARQKLVPDTQYAFNLLTSAKTGFILITGVMIMVISVLGIGYKAVQQVSAAYLFTTTKDALTAPAQIEQAFRLYESPTFVREIARLHLAQINNLLTTAAATPAEQQLFQQTITAGISAGRAAVSLDATDARNHAVLGDLYAVLAVINIEGAQDRADEAYSAAEKIDPTNPYYVLQKSALAFRAADSDRARALALQSLALKSNYTDAFLLLSQIDIATGDVERAIVSTQSLIALESNNPGRYYQLGVLHSASGNRPAAIEAFSTALIIDPSYANARYLRALEYAGEGNLELATSELIIVRDLNPDNGIVTSVIEKLGRGETVQASSTEAVVTEPNSVSVENGVTTTGTLPETDAVVPVNGGRAATVPPSITE